MKTKNHYLELDLFFLDPDLDLFLDLDLRDLDLRLERDLRWRDLDLVLLLDLDRDRRLLERDLDLDLLLPKPAEVSQQYYWITLTEIYFHKSTQKHILRALNHSRTRTIRLNFDLSSFKHSKNLTVRQILEIILTLRQKKMVNLKNFISFNTSLCYNY